MRHAASTSLLLGALLAAGCAHAPAPLAALPEVRWPAPPAAPRVRLEAILAGAAEAPGGSGWRRFLDAVAGVEREAEADVGLARPFGVAVRPSGEVLVADADRPGLYRLAPGQPPALVACPGRSWSAPMAVALEAGGAILVADAGAGLVIRIDAQGRCAPLGAGQLDRPTGVAWAPGRTYVADPPRHAVLVLDPAGALLSRLGGKESAGEPLAVPTGVAVAPDGTVLVVDALHARVARYAADGRWLGSFGAPGEDPGQLARPKGVAAGPDGRVYVSDSQRDVVLVFLADGAFDYELGLRGGEPGRLAHPAGLALAGGRLYVADSENRRIQVFQVLGGRS